MNKVIFIFLLFFTNTIFGQAPVASFSLNPTTNCVGQMVIFSNTSVAQPGAVYTWNFGPTAFPDPIVVGEGPHQVQFLAPGPTTITLTVTDINGTDTATETINVGPGPVITASPNSTICSGSSITISATGGIAYDWDNGLGAGASHLVNPSNTTTYTVIGADAAGCLGAAQVTITVSGQAPTLVMSSTPTTCFGSATGSASVVATGNGPFQYQWSPIGGINNVANNLPNNTYSVTVTDANGCFATGQVVVTAPPQILVNAVTIDSTDCNEDNGSIIVNASGGTGTLTYNWAPVSGNGPVITGLGAGSYQVTITDANGCFNSFNYVVNLLDNFDVVGFPEDSTILYGQSIDLFVGFAPDDINPSISWAPATGLSCTNCPNPTAGPTQTTAYVVTVTATNGCSQSDTVLIRVIQPCGDVFFPTIFSPNDDGLHDNLCVLGPCIASAKFSIYNRLGELVYSSISLTDCWDGTFRNRPALPGVYAFQVEATLTDGTIVEKKGNVTLVK